MLLQTSKYERLSDNVKKVRSLKYKGLKYILDSHTFAKKNPLSKNTSKETNINKQP